jgi:hypothetical protein
MQGQVVGLQQELEAAKASMGGETAGLQTQLKAAQDAAAAADAGKESAVVELQGELTAMQGQVVALQQELEAAKASMGGETAGLQTQLKAAQDAVAAADAGKENVVAEWQDNMHKLQTRLADAQHGAIAGQAQVTALKEVTDKVITAKEAEMSELQAQLATAKGAMEVVHTAKESELAELRAQLATERDISAFDGQAVVATELREAQEVCTQLRSTLVAAVGQAKQMWEASVSARASEECANTRLAEVETERESAQRKGGQAQAEAERLREVLEATRQGLDAAATDSSAHAAAERVAAACAEAAKGEAAALEAARDQALVLLKAARAEGAEAMQGKAGLEARLADMEGVQAVEREDAAERYREVEARLERIQKVLKQKRTEVEELQARAAAEKAARVQAEEEAAAAREAVEHARETAEGERAVLEAQVGAAEERAAVEERAGEVAERARSGGEADAAALHSALKAAEERAAGAEAKLLTCDAQMQSVVAELEEVERTRGEAKVAQTQLAVLRQQLATVQVQASEAERHRQRALAAEETAERAEAELVRMSLAEAGLEVRVREAQEELAVAEAALQDREKEMEDYVTKGRLNQVVEASEQKARALQQEVVRAHAELKELREKQAAQAAGQAESVAAVDSVKKLKEQVRHLNRELTEQQSKATSDKRSMEAGAKRNAEESKREHSEQLAGRQHALVLAEEQLKQANAKYAELHVNFIGWRGRARAMLEEKDREVETAKARSRRSSRDTPAATGLSPPQKSLTAATTDTFLTHTERLAAGEVGGAAAAQAGGGAGGGAGKELGAERAEEEQKSGSQTKAGAEAAGQGLHRKREEFKEKMVDLEYVRNVMVKYLCTPPIEKDQRERMLPAIAVLLELKAEELQQVRTVQAQVSRVAPLTEQATTLAERLGGFFG